MVTYQLSVQTTRNRVMSMWLNRKITLNPVHHGESSDLLHWMDYSIWIWICLLCLLCFCHQLSEDLLNSLFMISHAKHFFDHKMNFYSKRKRHQVHNYEIHWKYSSRVSCSYKMVEWTIEDSVMAAPKE